MTTELVPRCLPKLYPAGTLPALFLPNEHAAERFLDFFTSNIRNKNTRRAYYKAVCRFADWCEGREVHQLFRTAGQRAGGAHRMTQSDAYRMIKRRAGTAGIKTKIGNHSLRATGITDYLKSGGTLEHAQEMANHSSPRTTKLCDRRNNETSLDEHERVGI